jgi:diguanylate cyclase (GGDEF)-like protein
VVADGVALSFLNLRSVAVFVMAVLLLVGGILFGLRDVQRQGAGSLAQTRASDAVLFDLYSAAAELQAFVEGLDGTRVPYDTARGALDNAIASAASVGGNDPSVAAESRAAQQWTRVANGAVLRVRGQHLHRLPASTDQRLDNLIQQAASANAAYAAKTLQRFSSHVGRVRWQLALAPFGLAVLLALGLWVLARGERARRRDARGFSDTLQVMQTQDETYDLVKRYLERVLPRSKVVVLARNNANDHLEPRTRASDIPGLEAKLLDAASDGCLAVRLGRPFEHGPGHEPLLSCSLCGGLKRAYCVPSLVGGEVIGSVLVEHQRRLLPESDRTEIAGAVSQAAPVLANLRNLGLAESRALTDALTGLPNARALQHQLKHAFAQAERADAPLSLIMLDLDHFKKTNDTLGHDKGDELLAAVGAVLATSIRTSDFAARRGGEEFVVLLPATNQAGAAALAETLRQAVAAITLPGIPHPISASLGVATFPADGQDSDTLLRNADKALYEAKAGGRNRVVITTTASPQPPHELAA